MDKSNNSIEELKEETIRNYENYVNPSMARLFRFMGLAVVEDRSEGCYIYDTEGHRYLDCLGGYGVFSLGHSHPEVIKAVKDQLEKMPLGSKVLFDEPVGNLSKKIAEITPGNLQYTFLCNSGTEAVEGAIKLARLSKNKPGIISTYNSFHGKTLGSLSATGRDLFRQPCEPLLPYFKHVPFGDAEAIADAIDENTAAVILEPIQGEGGIIVPGDDYLPKVREICNAKGVLLIIDEVQTGLGRTGKMFAVEHWAVIPDIICMAKALGGGVMPIGAFTATPEVWEVLITSPFLHTSTFGGNPLAASAAVAAIEVIEKENLVQEAAKKGEAMISRLRKTAEKYPQVIKEVRGKGLLIGLHLAKEGLGGFIMSELIQDDVIVAYTLNNPSVIRIEPPLIINNEQMELVIKSVEKSAAKAAEIADDVD